MTGGAQPCQRWRSRRQSWRHPDEGGFYPARYDVAALAWRPALDFVVAHHYSGAFSSAVRRYGTRQTIYLNDPTYPDCEPPWLAALVAKLAPGQARGESA